METKKLSFGEAIASCFKKFACFRGRARRSELLCFFQFYFFSLAFVLLIEQIPINIIYRIVSNIFGIEYKVFAMMDIALAVIIVVSWFILHVPFIAVLVRRLHDTGHSGWWLLLAFLPIVNFLVLYWLIQDSEKQENRYGKSPKYVNLTAETFTPDEQV